MRRPCRSAPRSCAHSRASNSAVLSPCAIASCSRNRSSCASRAAVPPQRCAAAARARGGQRNGAPERAGRGAKRKPCATADRARRLPGPRAGARLLLHRFGQVRVRHGHACGGGAAAQRVSVGGRGRAARGAAPRKRPAFSVSSHSMPTTLGGGGRLPPLRRSGSGCCGCAGGGCASEGAAVGGDGNKSATGAEGAAAACFASAARNSGRQPRRAHAAPRTGDAPSSAAAAAIMFAEGARSRRCGRG